MFGGTKIKINEEEFIVPPLSLGQLRNGAMTKLREHDELVAAGKTFEATVVRGDIILEALRRNYPDFEEKKLFDWLDMANTSDLWLSVLGASGFMPGEDQAAETEAKANGISSPSIAA